MNPIRHNNLLQSNAPVIQVFNFDGTSMFFISFFVRRIIVGLSFKNIRYFSGFLIILFIINCLSGWSQLAPESQSGWSQQVLELQTGWGQLAPEPPHGIMAGQPAYPDVSAEHGLLFRLSGRNGFEANYAAGGQTLPNYLRNVRITEDGPYWHAIEAEDSQLLSYWAPGNIYAQRGTLSFFWRSRYTTGSTKFPVFRIGYADHSNWDKVWLRIDYNGSGFDAFVTDSGLSRTHISYYMDEPPGPEEWVHIAMSWDETEGIRFYINGMLVEKISVSGMVFDTALDQFGPHSVSPYQKQNQYDFKPRGDLADLRIYDRMLSDDDIFTLARGERVIGVPEFRRNMVNRRWRDAWWNRHGWNLPNEAPPLLTSPHTSVRKVEIHNTTDIKHWHWKANDGIRETSWPGASNWPGLPERYNFFVLPDRDSYSLSGQTVRFHIPDKEPWNHIEIWGKAWGQITHESDHTYDHTFSMRNKHQVKSYHRLEESKKGGIIRFDNALTGEPIGSFMAYNVSEGKAPADRHKEIFTLAPALASGSLGNKAMDKIAGFIYGRYPADERTMMTGIPEGETPPEKAVEHNPYAQPVIHILLPYPDLPDKGLDGIEIELPEMNVKPTHKEVFPMNLRIKDPLWQLRDLADFSFSIEPDKNYTLWIDTRDRILPEGRALHLTLAGAGPGLEPALLEGAKVRLVYKSKDKALTEHLKDRFTQIRDIHAHNPGPSQSPRLNSYNRFYADLQDILKYDPDHWLAKTYRYRGSRDIADRPEYDITKAPKGIPEWAHLQIEYLRHLERMIMYYINERQISNGEFGGGPSYDGDFANILTGAALTGINPDEILESLLLNMTSYYNQDRETYNAALKHRSLPLLTNYLSIIQKNELHAYEEGIKVVGQLQLADHGTPLHFNRGMKISRRLLEDLTQINPFSHRIFISRYDDNTITEKEYLRQWPVPGSYKILHPLYLVARYNGNPELQKMFVDMADSVLAYIDDEENIHTRINFKSGKSGSDGIQETWPLFLAAYHLSGDSTYFDLISEKVQKTREFNPDKLIARYTEEIKELGIHEYINTEGSIPASRILSNQDAIQQDRLGGIAMSQTNNTYPQNYVRWYINKPGNYESLAIFLSAASENSIDIIIYNLEEDIVRADMTPENIVPGRWLVRQGLDTTGNQQIDSYYPERIVNLKRGEKLELAFEPHEHTIINLELIEPYSKGYWERADLGIGRDDIKVDGNEIKVRIHSLGAIDAPETYVELRDANGNIVTTQKVPSLEAPVDLIPRWTEIRMKVPEGRDISRGSLIVDPYHFIPQISRSNTIVKW